MTTFNQLNRVLILDDDQEFAASLEDILIINGYKTRVFNNAFEALAYFKENPCPISLIDYRLKETDGIEVLQKMKQLEPLSEVIIVTAFGELSAAVRSLKEGASDFLLKPFDSEGLFIAIHRAMERVKKNLSIIDHTNKLKNEVKKRTIELEISNRKLHQLTLTDELTGLANFRSFKTAMEKEFARSRRFQRHLSLVMLDIDNFKQYNDTHGHQEGNRLLKKIAITLKNKIRRHIDMAFRYGGEEFAILLPEADLHIATIVSGRIKTFIELSLDGQTISGGVASLLEDDPIDIKTFINMADQALYHAKEIGKNRIVSFGEIPKTKTDH